MINWKFWKKRNEQNQDMIEQLEEKIFKEFPELTVTSIGNVGSSVEGGLTFSEQVKAYYELKMMEHTKRQDKITVVLTILNIIVVIILGYLVYIKP